MAFREMEAGFLEVLGAQPVQAPAQQAPDAPPYVRMSRVKSEFWARKRAEAAKLGITVGELLERDREAKAKPQVQAPVQKSAQAPARKFKQTVLVGR